MPGLDELRADWLRRMNRLSDALQAENVRECDRLERYLKAHAPWHDQTGDARRSLQVNPDWHMHYGTADGYLRQFDVDATLSYDPTDAPYVTFLEQRNFRYAGYIGVIGPTAGVRPSTPGQAWFDPSRGTWHGTDYPRPADQRELYFGALRQVADRILNYG